MTIKEIKMSAFHDELEKLGFWSAAAKTLPWLGKFFTNTKLWGAALKGGYQKGGWKGLALEAEKFGDPVFKRLADGTLTTTQPLVTSGFIPRMIGEGVKHTRSLRSLKDFVNTQAGSFGSAIRRTVPADNVGGMFNMKYFVKGTKPGDLGTVYNKYLPKVFGKKVLGTTLDVQGKKHLILNRSLPGKALGLQFTPIGMTATGLAIPAAGESNKFKSGLQDFVEWGPLRPVGEIKLLKEFAGMVVGSK